jgi:hypothetical protein
MPSKQQESIPGSCVNVQESKVQASVGSCQCAAAGPLTGLNATADKKALAAGTVQRWCRPVGDTAGQQGLSKLLMRKAV